MSAPFIYSTRSHAGKILAAKLVERHIENPIIFALPRGGVPIGHEIAKALHVSLEVLMVRKIGAPFNPEYGIGAICEDLRPLFNAGELLHFEDLDDAVVKIVDDEKRELTRRVQYYRGTRKLPEVKNRNVILVDDGLATGVTAAAAGKFLRSKDAKQIFLAVPVGPKNVSELLTENIDEIICPYYPDGFMAIGSWYQYFPQVTDEEVMNILRLYHSDTPIDLTL
jgi:putative phosphoribosyl transferase